jgi:ribonuclease BN (tRNA processing enzyme)
MTDEAVLTFLGSGDAFGSAGRLQTCFHVRTKDASFLIDCGATACIGMKRCGIPLDDIDAIIISHYHADHFAGVAFVLLESRVIGRTRPLALSGPPGLRERVATSMDALFPGAGTDYDYPIGYVEYTAGRPVTVGPTRVTAFPVQHAPSTRPHALRVEIAGRTIAYSGDTEWTDALIDVARGADVFICEVSGYHGPVGIHLDYSTLLEHRAALDCERLILTHMGEDVIDNADRVSRGLDATLASDGMTITL